MSSDLAPVTFGTLFSRSLASVPQARTGIALLLASAALWGFALFMTGYTATPESPTGGWQLLVLPAMLGMFVAQAVVTKQVVAHLEGQPLAPRAALRAGWSRSGNFFLAWLVVSLVSSLAALLLIVPGILVFCRWSLAPALVVEEKLGLGAALRRSAELTEGHRLSIFLTFLVVGIVGQIAVYAVSFVFAAAIHPVASVIAIVPLMSLYMVVFYAIPAVALQALRRAREGESQSTLVSVFA